MIIPSLFKKGLAYFLFFSLSFSVVAQKLDCVVDQIDVRDFFSEEEHEILRKMNLTNVAERTASFSPGFRLPFLNICKREIAYYRFLNIGDYRAPRYESIGDIGRSLPALMALWPERPGAYRIGYTNVMHSLQRFYIMEREQVLGERTRSWLIQNSPGLFSDGYEPIYTTLLTNALDIGLSPDADRFRDYEKIKFYECFETTECDFFPTTNTVALLASYLGDIRRQIDAIDAGDAQCALLPEPIREGLRKLGGAPKEIVEFPQGDSYKTPQDYRAMLVQHYDRILRYIDPSSFPCLLDGLPYDVQIAHLRTFTEQARLTPPQIEENLARVAAYFKRRHDEEVEKARKEAEWKKELEQRSKSPHSKRLYNSGKPQRVDVSWGVSSSRRKSVGERSRHWPGRK